jgi:hypothetical protein
MPSVPEVSCSDERMPFLREIGPCKTGCSIIQRSSRHGMYAILGLISEVHSPVVRLCVGSPRLNTAVPTADSH